MEESPTETERNSKSFWNSSWNRFEPFDLDCSSFRECADKSDGCFIRRIGDVSQKKVLEIGGGNGSMAVYLAKMGADVTVIDSSEIAVKKIFEMARKNHVESIIDIRCLNAADLAKVGKSFDLVLGKFILHHIEPFEEFSELLSGVLKKNGKGIFLENSSRNPLLMFSRKTLTGKYGIPKYGDEEEYPFEPKEIEVLRNKFGQLSIHYPEFLFFYMLNAYIFRDNKRSGVLLTHLDEWCYSYLPWLRKYSYRQIIEFEKVSA